jgi:hypothetical protein
MTTKYWVAHCRGPNFRKLRERGFLTFYPDIDDYVFLRCLPANEKLLRKQTELGVAFLKAREAYTQVTEADILRMTSRTTTRKVALGAQILVTEGFGSNLEGTVLETDEAGLKVRCDLVGFNRHYDVWLDLQEIVERTPATEIHVGPSLD